jgi:hypothetical protein
MDAKSDWSITMKDTFGQRGTLRKQSEILSSGASIFWTAVGMVLAMAGISWVMVWIIEGLK